MLELFFYLLLKLPKHTKNYAFHYVIWKNNFWPIDNLKLIFRKPRTSGFFLSYDRTTKKQYVDVLGSVIIQPRTSGFFLFYDTTTKVDVPGFLVEPRTSGFFPSYEEKTEVRCTRLFFVNCEGGQAGGRNISGISFHFCYPDKIRIKSG